MKVSVAGISSQCCWQTTGTQIAASRPTCVMPGKAKKRGHNGCRYQWQINMRSIHHFPSPRHSDQAHSKHGRMLPAWPMFSSRALELAGSKLHSSPLRQGNGCTIDRAKLPSSPILSWTQAHKTQFAGETCPGKEATSDFSVLVPGLSRVCL